MNELAPLDYNALPDIGSARLPVTYESAVVALRECANMDECQDWADKMAAMASYARQAEDDTLKKLCIRIQGRAIRRCGELLNEVRAGQGARDGKRQEGDLPPLSRTDAADQAGLSEHQRKTALRIANIPEDEFERQIESDDPPTVTALAEQGRQRRPPTIDTSYLENQTPDDFHQMILLGGLCDWIIERSAGINLRAAARRLSDERRNNIGEKLAKCEIWLTSAKEVFNVL